MPQKILVVDDDNSILELMTMMLEEAGYSVVTAGEGAVAINKLAANGISAVLLDYMMPGIDGLQVAAKIRELDKDIPVIIVTAFDSLHLRERAKRLDINELVTKPFEPENLMKKLYSALHRNTDSSNQ